MSRWRPFNAPRQPATQPIKRIAKKALDSDEPDGDRVRTLVNKLGESVGKIAPRSPDEKATPKLEELGKVLATA